MRKDYIDDSATFAGRAHTKIEAERGAQTALVTDSPHLTIIGQTVAAETTPQRAERLFHQNCAACHSFTNEHGLGITATSPSAPNLQGFASREWIDGLLDPEKFATAHYFGNTIHADGQMFDAVEGLDRDDEEFAKLVAALSIEAELPLQADLDQASIDEGLDGDARAEVVETFGCTDCHSFHDIGSDVAPDLTAYGSRKWITEFVANPAGDRFYGRSKNDRMPAFAGHGEGSGRLLTPEEIELLARFIRGEDLSDDQP